MRYNGFSLAELLVAMGVLGIIATFSIPKVLTATQSKQKVAITREVLSSLAQARLLLQNEGKWTASTTAEQLATKMNFIRYHTAGLIDTPPANYPWMPSHDCAAIGCFEFHNGAKAMFYCDFAGTTAQDALAFMLDTDGQYRNSGDSIWLVVYFDGKIRTEATINPNTRYCDGTYNPSPTDPDWWTAAN
jgi:prepilin-type N-terminal cleavage/methylation domain-containing protein